MTLSSTSLPQDLLLAHTLLFTPLHLNWAQMVPEPESSEYKAYTFLLNEKSIVYRESHITPTKTGQFVTLWKRSTLGPIAPFSISDPVDFAIISARKEEQWGLFLFPKEVLHKKGILSDEKKEGKRALRVYPPWDIATSTQAKKTQQWQLAYFLELKKESPIDFNRAKRLLNV